MYNTIQYNTIPSYDRSQVPLVLYYIIVTIAIPEGPDRIIPVVKTLDRIRYGKVLCDNRGPRTGGGMRNSTCSVLGV